MLVTLLIALLVGVVVFMLARYVMDLLKVPQPFYNLILVVLILIIVIWVVERSGLL